MKTATKTFRRTASRTAKPVKKTSINVPEPKPSRDTILQVMQVCQELYPDITLVLETRVKHQLSRCTEAEASALVRGAVASAIEMHRVTVPKAVIKVAQRDYSGIVLPKDRAAIAATVWRQVMGSDCTRPKKEAA